MLAIGSLAPEIDAEASGGRFRLSEQKSRLCTVLYFFPKAFTPGCTAETGRFRDNYPELRIAGAAVAGVSRDNHDTQCRFAKSLEVQFPILSDSDGAIARAYDVRWPIIGLAKRVTYVIGPERTILAAFHHEILIEKHRDEVLRFVDDLYRKRAHAPG
jgi:peroxiredoxin